ncbi:CcmD family protein [Rapidithrix thailandica]|uniref:CcmD family protein n=1 Tax=Rapidithrix thailandica TaxID=413964 RepID=A0AAW9S781_9BACT
MLLNKKLKYFTLALCWTFSVLLISPVCQAQDKIQITEDDYTNTQVEMADVFRQNGKIYVVVATLGIIMAGFLTYVVILDRKVKKLEETIQSIEK